MMSTSPARSPELYNYGDSAEYDPKKPVVIGYVSDAMRLPATFNDFTTTYPNSKVLCMEWMYGLHIACAYLLVAAGFVALVTRLHPRLKRYHVHAGRTYLCTMLFAEATSILIINDGMPRSILFFFTICLFSLSVGFGAIRVHQERTAAAVARAADELLAAQGGQLRKGTTVTALLDDARQAHFARPRTFAQRMLSLKALHGFLLTLSWYQMAGRAFVTNPVSAWHGCQTYPALKRIGPNGEIALQVEQDPTFFANEAVFAAGVTVPVVLVLAAVGSAWSAVAAYRQRQAAAQQSSAELGGGGGGVTPRTPSPPVPARRSKKQRRVRALRAKQADHAAPASSS